MAKLIPFSGTVAQLYQSYSRRCFIGLFVSGYGDALNGIGVAGYADTVAGAPGEYVFYFGNRVLYNVQNRQISGFVIV